MQLTIGADPEFFLTKDNAFASAYGIVPGTKKAPFKVEGGAVQVDGMAVEFNVDPTDRVDTFLYNIDTVLYNLREMVPAEYDFNIVPSIDIDEGYIKTQPYEAVRLGCDPDFNAYTETQNEPPDHNRPMRTAAGHVHLGWTKVDDIYGIDHFMSCIELTKQLDCTLGLWSIWNDDDKRRRQMYGKAGCFRPKPYGMEYRVLSNFWINNQQLAETVFVKSQQAFNDLLKGEKYWEYLAGKGFDNVRQIVDEGNPNDAYSAHETLMYRGDDRLKKKRR